MKPPFTYDEIIKMLKLFSPDLTEDVDDDTLTALIDEAWAIISSLSVDLSNVAYVKMAVRYRVLAILYVIDVSSSGYSTIKIDQIELSSSSDDANRWATLYDKLIDDWRGDNGWHIAADTDFENLDLSTRNWRGL